MAILVLPQRRTRKVPEKSFGRLGFNQHFDSGRARLRKDIGSFAKDLQICAVKPQIEDGLMRNLVPWSAVNHFSPYGTTLGSPQGILVSYINSSYESNVYPDQWASDDQTAIAFVLRKNTVNVDPTWLYYFYHNNFGTFSIYADPSADTLHVRIGSMDIDNLNGGAAIIRSGDWVPVVVNANHVSNSADRFIEVWLGNHKYEYRADSTSRAAWGVAKYSIGGRHDSTSRYGNSYIPIWMHWNRLLNHGEAHTLINNMYHLIDG